jgi:YesN/AraC family two-component response regulator
MDQASVFEVAAGLEEQRHRASRRPHHPSGLASASLPRPESPDRRATTAPQELKAMDSLSRSESLPVVLVVDDDETVRSFVRIALEEKATMVEAPDGEQALRMLERLGGHNVDLVLLDYVIPNQSGLEILRVVRRRWPWLPVVIITGFGSEDVAIHAFRAGARDYLRKPIDVDQLRQTVVKLTAKNLSGPRPGREPLGAESHVPRAVHPSIARAVTYAGEHFTESITLSEIAREAFLSKFHFCRLFHREMGFSFREYLQGLKIRRAKALLADPSLSVTEVAYAAGFNDLSNFDKVFRKIVGVPPSAYRRTILPS